MKKYLFEVGQQLADVFYNQENIKPLNQSKMKTAVEWLIEHLNLDETSPNYNKLTIEKAKEMEKIQNKYFYDNGFYTGRCTHNDKDESFEYFFNSYKSE
jgi:hypothetical protein